MYKQVKESPTLLINTQSHELVKKNQKVIKFGFGQIDLWNMLIWLPQVWQFGWLFGLWFQKYVLLTKKRVQIIQCDQLQNSRSNRKLSVVQKQLFSRFEYKEMCDYFHQFDCQSMHCLFIESAMFVLWRKVFSRQRKLQGSYSWNIKLCCLWLNQQMSTV